MKGNNIGQMVKYSGYAIAQEVYWNYLTEVVGTCAEAAVSERVLDTESFRNDCLSDKFYPLTDNVSRLNSEWLKKIQPEAQEGVRAFDTTPWEFSKPFVAEVKDVTLVGPHSVAVTQDRKIIADTLTFDSSKRIKYALSSAILQSPYQSTKSIYTGKPVSTTGRVNSAILLNGGWNNYYHWIVEHLAKLRGLEQYKKKTSQSPTIILPKDPKPYMIQSLEMAGISAENWIKWSENQMVVNKLIVPSYPEFTPGVFKWLRKTILSPELIDPTSPKRIFVSRQKAKKRRVKNYKPLEEMLKRQGFVTVFTEDLPFEDQVRLFHNADVVVSPHGAGLTDIVWGEDMTVFELFPECIKSPYYVLSEMLDHTYEAVICDAVGDADIQPNKDLSVDISHLKNRIERRL